MSRKIMISFRADKYIIDEMTRILPKVDGIENTSDLLRAALSYFIRRYKKDNEIL